eukprot:455331_1
MTTIYLLILLLLMTIHMLDNHKSISDSHIASLSSNISASNITSTTAQTTNDSNITDVTKPTPFIPSRTHKHIYMAKNVETENKQEINTIKDQSARIKEKDDVIDVGIKELSETIERLIKRIQVLHQIQNHTINTIYIQENRTNQLKELLSNQNDIASRKIHTDIAIYYYIETFDVQLNDNLLSKKITPNTNSSPNLEDGNGLLMDIHAHKTYYNQLNVPMIYIQSNVVHKLLKCILVVICGHSQTHQFISYFTFLSMINVVQSTKIIYGEWNMGITDTLPRASSGMAAGLWNNEIHLVGGYRYTNNNIQQQYVIFNGTHFEDINQYYTTVSIYGRNHFYTQIQNNLFMVQSNGVYIAVLDLETKNFTENFISIPTGVDHQSCLTSTNDLLIVNGGMHNGWLKSTQIYNITNMSWNDGPDMNVARAYHGCVVHKNILYSIGGHNGNGLSSIETANMTDTNPSFTFSSMSLLYKMWSFGLILLEDDMLIIGGIYYGSGSYY